MAALRELDVLDSAPEVAFDAIVQAAAAACGTRMAALSLVDADRQWFKARVGLRTSQTPREASICSYAMHGDSVLEVPNTTLDARFSDNPLVTGELGLRFYAGAPLVLQGGERVGALCVLDQEPKTLDAAQREMLDLLGRAAAYTLQARMALRREAGLRRELAANTARRQALFDNAPVGIFKADRRGMCTYVNRRWREITGLDGDDGLGVGWAKAVCPEDIGRVHETWRQAVAEGSNGSAEFRFVRPDGTLRTVLARWTHVDDDEHSLIGTIEDLTEQRHAEREREREHELLRVTLESIGDAVITTDDAGLVTWLNPVAERMTGWSVAEACGRRLEQVFRIVDERTRLPAPDPVRACIAQGRVVGLAEHTLLIGRDHAEYGIEDSTAPIRSSEGQFLGVVLVFHDVTEQRRLVGEMSHRARHDALTGLINRAEFETRLRRALHRSYEDSSEHALLFIDLDRFKLVNDACGHAAGDLLLQQVARLFGEVVRTRDTLARFGGDEFAVLLEHCSVAQAQRVAHQICERIDDYRFIHDGRRFRIGASIGLAPLNERWSGIAAALQAADAACYAAKDDGRNRVHVWSDDDGALRGREGEMRWAQRLERALDEGEFELFAQRIVSLRNGSAAPPHAEVLLRLPDGHGGHHSAGVFIPAAERLHMAARIDRWVLEKVLGWLSADERQRVEVTAEALTTASTLAVNLSGQSIGDRVFQRHALEALQTVSAAVRARLWLELTETVAVTRMTEAADFVGKVRALGVRVALDDFGAGASSFGYLRSFAVDAIKIDGAYLRELLDEPLSVVAVRSFVEAARTIGATTTAEFVDRPELLARIREMGIDAAQGFLLHRPEPLEAWHASDVVLPKNFSGIKSD